MFDNVWIKFTRQTRGYMPTRKVDENAKKKKNARGNPVIDYHRIQRFNHVVILLAASFYGDKYYTFTEAVLCVWSKTTVKFR